VYVAEKVAYWISNDVQNAEMKLEGIGLDPVEVSIRMHGNEAHVSFRTDELQARAALENASTHLKELLQREGLVLTGVSVGTAGAGDSGGGDGKSRQGARQSNVSAIVSPSTRSGPVAGRSAGGRLDLFV
jgi:flagellar hook-length control protein FliK